GKRSRVWREPTRECGRTHRAVESRAVSSQIGKAAVYTKGQWKAQAIGNTRHSRQAPSESGSADTRCDIRTRFLTKQLWVQTKSRPTGCGKGSQPRTTIRA